ELDAVERASRLRAHAVHLRQPGPGLQALESGVAGSDRRQRRSPHVPAVRRRRHGDPRRQRSPLQRVQQLHDRREPHARARQSLVEGRVRGSHAARERVGGAERRHVKLSHGRNGGAGSGGVDGHSRYQYHWDTNNIAPRLGLSYQVNQKTVVRAGYGHIFGPSNQAAQGTVGPFGFRTENLWVTTIDGITPLNTLRNPYPHGFLPSPGAAKG